MSNLGGVNDVGINGSSEFDPVAESRRLGDINSYAINGNEAINGSAFVASALTPTAALIEQNVAYLFVGTVVDIVQQVLLRYAGGGLNNPLILIEQSVAFLKAAESVIDIENTVIAP